MSGTIWGGATDYGYFAPRVVQYNPYEIVE